MIIARYLITSVWNFKAYFPVKVKGSNTTSIISHWEVEYLEEEGEWEEEEREDQEEEEKEEDAFNQISI